MVGSNPTGGTIYGGVRTTASPSVCGTEHKGSIPLPHTKKEGEIMKPIVFLDFDGVVETIYWEKDKDGTWSYNVHKYGKEELNNKQAIGWLNELYNKQPYDVVIDSSWRYNMTEEELQDLLIKSGFNPDIKVIGKTPKLYLARGIEIQRWIDDNNFKGKFIIIDDDSDMCHLLPFLVRCDCQLGFTIYDYQKALKLLQ